MSETKALAERKPLVLIEVEGGVVQKVSYPEGVNVVVRDYDSIDEGDVMGCAWCDEGILPSTLDNSNLCPHCHNPTVAMEFQMVEREKEFLCINGGRWRKVDANNAVCTEDDSAFVRGDLQSFIAEETVFPFDLVIITESAIG